MSARPDPLPRFYRWKTNLFQLPVLTVITAICGSISLLVSFADKHGRVQHRIARFWAHAVVWGTGCSITVRGMENLHSQPVAVYASNHTSYMDTPVIFASLPFQFRILAKKELWPIAFIGWYLRSIRSDSDRYSESARNTFQPEPGCQSAAFGNVAVCLPGRRADSNWRTETVSFRCRLSRYSRPGAAGADCAHWGLRSAADSHAPFVSRGADGESGRAYRYERTDAAPNRRVERSFARGDRGPAGARSVGGTRIYRTRCLPCGRLTAEDFSIGSLRD